MPENLPLKEDRDLEMLTVTPRGEEDSPAGGLQSRALCVTETWWDNPRVLGQTGSTWLPAELCHFPVLRACQRL